MQANRQTHASKEAWEEYCASELKGARPILEQLGFTLDTTQVHTGGERYLMSGHKLVLTGRRTSDNKRVVIKVSSYASGSKEIEEEHKAREVLKKINFAYRTFFIPEELLFIKKDGYTIDVTAYIEQERPFIMHELEEQFFLALRAFETQEGVHATTYAHAATIREAFGTMGAREYIQTFRMNMEACVANDRDNKELAETFAEALAFMEEHRTIIERYSGFLTHNDFVPHNLRVSGKEVYLLDYSAILFGNKYESWARFLNFMIHHNRPLELALANYVRTNRGEEEYLSLRLMRLHIIGILLNFYTGALGKTEGDLHTLTRVRVGFWTNVMQHILKDETVPEKIIDAYIADTERLRSTEEKARQKEILGLEKKVSV
ncbi:MAG TPA: hypothetical protein VMR46_01520 [Candidatus Paceibacterota bacterium]|nr:hypothetical protein [Candidatus Paceibacterota bacterium]